MRGDGFKLARVRRVFGVPDADDVASAEIQGIVHGAGFGGKPATLRHFHNAHPLRQSRACKRVLCKQVFFFEHQHDIQKCPRIGERAEPVDQGTRDLGFFEKRHQNRDSGQTARAFLCLFFKRGCGLSAGGQGHAFHRNTNQEKTHGQQNQQADTELWGNVEQSSHRQAKRRNTGQTKPECLRPPSAA